MNTIHGKLLIAFLLLAPLAKADTFSYDPSTVYDGEIVFDLTLFFPNAGQVTWGAFVADTEPDGTTFLGSCQGPILQPQGDAYPYCGTDAPMEAFVPAGSGPFDVATLLFGVDPGLEDFSHINTQTATVSLETPEPGSGIFTIFGLTMIGLLAMFGWAKRMERN